MASQDQMARAARICRQFGVRPPVPHGLYKSMLELVEADEKPGPRPEPTPLAPPVSDARKVLAPVKKYPKPPPAAQPLQEGLW